MPTTIIPALSHPAPDTAIELAMRQPHFECVDGTQSLTLDVFIPGVEPSGVEITTRGPDLTVVARKARPVRVNWQALHLEIAQRDYELKLRLGRGLDFDSLRAEMRDGVLHIVVPKRNFDTARLHNARRVA